MIDFRILHLEDEIDCAENFKTTLDVYNEKNGTAIEYIHVNNFEDFKKYTDKDFDAAVIDIYLGSNPNQGYDALAAIPAKLMRIPCVVYSGTADTNMGNKYALKLYKRDQLGADVEIIDYFVNIYKTGIMDVLGGKGALEKHLNEIFHKNIKDNIDEWINCVKTSEVDVKKSLLRFIGSCIEDTMFEDDEKSLVNEMYIMPVLSDDYRPGVVVKNMKTNDFHIIITPECDIVKREGGKRNSNNVQVCDIELFPYAYNKCFSEALSKDKQKSAILNKALHCHFLPMYKTFPGGAINFRNIKSIEISALESDYDIILKITASYVKDILGRFSAYYIRRGQPELDISPEVIISALNV